MWTCLKSAYYCKLLGRYEHPYSLMTIKKFSKIGPDRKRHGPNQFYKDLYGIICKESSFLHNQADFCQGGFFHPVFPEDGRMIF